MRMPRPRTIERIVVAYIRKGHPAYGLAALTLLLLAGLAALALVSTGLHGFR